MGVRGGYNLPRVGGVDRTVGGSTSAKYVGWWNRRRFINLPYSLRAVTEATVMVLVVSKSAPVRRCRTIAKIIADAVVICRRTAEDVVYLNNALHLGLCVQMRLVWALCTSVDMFLIPSFVSNAVEESHCVKRGCSVGQPEFTETT